jgi:hypothetical protein
MLIENERKKEIGTRMRPRREKKERFRRSLR